MKTHAFMCARIPISASFLKRQLIHSTLLSMIAACGQTPSFTENKAADASNPAAASAGSTSTSGSGDATASASPSGSTSDSGQASSGNQVAQNGSGNMPSDQSSLPAVSSSPNQGSDSLKSILPSTSQSSPSSSESSPGSSKAPVVVASSSGDQCQQGGKNVPAAPVTPVTPPAPPKPVDVFTPPTIQTTSNTSYSIPNDGSSSIANWDQPLDCSAQGGGSSSLPTSGSNEFQVAETINVSCGQGTDSSVATITELSSATNHVSAQITGQFCPNSTNTLSVLFIVDFSGSMADNDPINNSTQSCGRLDAAWSVYNRMVAIANPGDSISFAVEPFGSDIVKPFVINMTSMASFKSKLTYQNFCRYIDTYGYGSSFLSQSQAGVQGNTNYQAAFTNAESMLANRTGRKEIFFISDGEPNLPYNDPVGLATQAGAKLRADIPNVTMSSILLNTQSSDAQAILADVAGSPSRVALVASAAQLAKTILNFPAPTVDTSSLVASITIAPYASQALKVESVTQSNGVWTYVLQPFTLLGVPGNVTANNITVSATGSDGSTYNSQLQFKYTQQ